ncbi:unnamed protein product [Spirodela intermedia]|uniref:Uncharacterized protein n=1 Tax=Spirodela intermedia TaxID=51605 RepID=A0A7I8JHD5_SPIIN|nr:unnamed protein product [Spirodela intermedia]CAA6669570.1 unnamed protein product [Spirodela intermedia]
MNRLFRNFRDFSIKDLGLAFAHDKRISLSWEKSIRFSTKKVETTEGELGQICDLLRERGSWDSLDARLGSVELSSKLVDSVLVHLREPINAKRSLGFFHWCSRRKKHDHGVRSYCLMIHVLVQAGLTVDARALLESVILKNSESDASLSAVVETLLSTYEVVLSGPRVFDLLVQTCSRLRLFDLSLRVCSHLGERGFLPSLISFNTLLHVVQRSDQNDLVWKIYEYMVVKRIYPNQFTVEILAKSMCKAGTLLKVVNILDSIHIKRCSPTVIVNAALVLRIIEQNRVGEGILLVKRMLQKNMILDDIACSLIIHAHCESGNSELAFDSYDDMLKRGHCMNAYVCAALIGLLCREGKTEEANLLTQEMLQAGLNLYEETYNVLIEWFSRSGRLQEALEFCNRMVDEGSLPSCRAANKLISRLCEAGNVERADGMLTLLLEKGFVPDESVYSDLISGFGRAGRFQAVLRLYHEVEWRGLSVTVLLYTSVIRSLCLCGKSTEAEKILAVMRGKYMAPTREIHELTSWASDGSQRQPVL